MSGKLSKCLHMYIYCYTQLMSSSELNECLLIHNFQNKRKRVLKYDCAINVTKPTLISGPFRDFLFYVILTISYLRTGTIETSSLTNYSMRPLINQMEIFSGILLASFNCQYFSTYTRELPGCLLGEIPDGGGGGGGQ